MGPTKHYATLRDTIELDYDFGIFLGCTSLRASSIVDTRCPGTSTRPRST